MNTSIKTEDEGSNPPPLSFSVSVLSRSLDEAGAHTWGENPWPKLGEACWFDAWRKFFYPLLFLFFFVPLFFEGKGVKNMKHGWTARNIFMRELKNKVRWKLTRTIQYLWMTKRYVDDNMMI